MFIFSGLLYSACTAYTLVQCVSVAKKTFSFDWVSYATLPPSSSTIEASRPRLTVHTS